MSLERKLKRWNKNPKKHMYHIRTEFNVRPINNGLGHSYEVFNGNFYAYNEEHARYLFYIYAEEHNMMLNKKAIDRICEVA